jgi:hypothetical protein
MSRTLKVRSVVDVVCKLVSIEDILLPPFGKPDEIGTEPGLRWNWQSIEKGSNSKYSYQTGLTFGKSEASMLDRTVKQLVIGKDVDLYAIDIDSFIGSEATLTISRDHTTKDVFTETVAGISKVK